MRSIILALFLLMLAGASVATAKSPMMDDKLTESEAAAFKAITAENDPPISLADLRVFTMSPWMAAPRPGLAVVAMGREPDNFDVAVLETQGSGWQVVAAINTNNDPVVDPGNAAVLDDLVLDVIPYNISKNEVAFGVRASTEFNSTSTYAGSTSLHLFRLHDRQLEEIFAADVASFDCDKTSGGGSCGKDKKSTVQFASTQHGGYYDILLKPAKNTVGETRHYEWQDGVYIPSDEPVAPHKSK